MLKLLAEDPRPQTNIRLYIFLFEKIRLWLSKLWKVNLKIKIIRKRRKLNPQNNTDIPRPE